MLYVFQNRPGMVRLSLARRGVTLLTSPVRCLLFLAGRYRHALAMWRSRQVLLGLDDRQLDDIGITRAEALQEAAKPFWRSVAPWLDNPPKLHGDAYLAGRPAEAIRSFYQERGRSAEY